MVYTLPKKKNLWFTNYQVVSVQVPGNSLKLKQLKILVEEQSSSAFLDFSTKEEAIAHLKEKVFMTSWSFHNMGF